MADIPMNELINDLLDVLIKHNIVDKHSLRNFLIRQRYKDLFVNQKMRSKEARRQIAIEFNLGEKTIEYIIYLQKQN
ncbi:MAG: hypothetical protein AB1521_16165 [Bacteroidota bacterium]